MVTDRLLKIHEYLEQALADETVSREGLRTVIANVRDLIKPFITIIEHSRKGAKREKVE